MKTTVDKVFGYEDGLTSKARLVLTNKKTVWTGKCRKCGEELEGTLEELQGHICHV